MYALTLEHQGLLQHGAEDSVVKPVCFGSYEEGHVSCDGPFEEGDPCLLRDLCSALPTLAETTGFGVNRLIKDLSVQQLWDLYDGRVSASLLRTRDFSRLQVHEPLKPVVPKKPFLYYYTAEHMERYNYFVKKLRSQFKPGQVLPTYCFLHGKAKRYARGVLTLEKLLIYTRRQGGFRSRFFWCCRIMPARKEYDIFSVYPRRRPHASLAFCLCYKLDTLRLALGERLLKELNPVSMVMNKRSLPTVIAADRRRLELVAATIKRLADTGEITNVV